MSQWLRTLAYPFRGPRFSSYCPHGSLQSSLILVAGDLIPSFDLHRSHTYGGQNTYRQHTHTYPIIKSKNR